MQLGFWIFIGTTLVIVCCVKGVVFRGIGELCKQKKIVFFYIVLSLLSFVLGVSSVAYLVYNHVINHSILTNTLVGVMFVVLITECLIFPFFIVDACISIFRKIFVKPPREVNANRRQLLKMTGIGLSILPFSTFTYGITKGKYNFTVKKQELFFEDLPKAFDGFHIVQFSDFHAGSFDSYDSVHTGMQLIKDQCPDLLVFTGDLVNAHANEVLPYKDILSSINAKYGKYSVLGNHDYPHNKRYVFTPEEADRNFETLKKHHADMGFTLLNNSNVKIHKGEADYIRLIGVENWGANFIRKGDLDKAIQNCSDDEFSVLLSHDPTHWEKKVIHHDKHINLTLSGHTHGMQMGIEALNIKWSPVQYVYKYWMGLYQEKQQYLYVNRGFGFIGFPGRVGVFPEITSIILRCR